MYTESFFYLHIPGVLSYGATLTQYLSKGFFDRPAASFFRRWVAPEGSSRWRGRRPWPWHRLEGSRPTRPRPRGGGSGWGSDRGSLSTGRRRSGANFRPGGSRWRGRRRRTSENRISRWNEFESRTLPILIAFLKQICHFCLQIRDLEHFKAAFCDTFLRIPFIELSNCPGLAKP